MRTWHKIKKYLRESTVCVSLLSSGPKSKETYRFELRCPAAPPSMEASPIVLNIAL